MTMTNRDPRLLDILARVRAMAVAIGGVTIGASSADDLISAGYLGVATALSRHNGEPSDALEGYCLLHARGAIFDELRRRDTMGRAGRRRARKVAAAIRALRHELGREPDEGEIAGSMQLPLDRYRHLREQMEYRTIGGDGFEADASDAGPMCDERDSAEQVLSKQQCSAVVTQFLRESKAMLTPRQAQTIELSFGAEKSGASVAKCLGLSEGRVSQLKKSALARLREFGSAHEALYQEAVA